MKKYNEVEESQKDDTFCLFFILPIILLALVIASVWTYVNWLNAL